MSPFPARPAPATTAPAGAAFSGDDRVERWRSLTLEANLAFEERQAIRARRLFEEALAIAEALLADARLAEGPDVARVAPLLHGITCNDIVELARQQGDRETPGIYLYRRAAYLISVIESPQASRELRSRCLLHLKVASSGLYEYFEQRGMWDAAAAFSERANAAMFSVELLGIDGADGATTDGATTDIDPPDIDAAEGEAADQPLAR
ncbi:MAG TPA: hypothetical protein VNN80_02485 [Polyangiaceae bacterium]|nr:hypothetical protein [Polyangiaceae bacterium]